MSVVITGISITSSIGNSISEVKKNMNKNVSGISNINYFDTSKLSCNVAGNIKDDVWDKVKSISENLGVDISSALSIYTIKKMIGCDFCNKHNNVGISLGTCNGGINSFSKYIFKNDKSKLVNYPPYIQSMDISKYFKFNGPKYSFNSACAASANSIAYGAEMIENGKTDTVIAGGCDPMSNWVFAGFNSLRTFNKNNCSPYSNDYGLNLGEAATFFILENKDKAIAEGKKIYGEISGYGLSNDAYHPTSPDKNGEGIAKAINMSLRMSNLNKSDIFYINSHGTGTQANDGAEYRGFKKVFGDSVPLISSMKGYVGHNLGAAASTELAITLIGLLDKRIYSNHNLNKYRPECNDEKILSSDYYVSNKNDIYFINNNAAFGGQNVSVIFHVNLNGNYCISSKKNIKCKKNVYVNGLSFANMHSYYNGKENKIIHSDKPLKDIYPSLYRRRMNNLTQVSIIAALNSRMKNINNYGLVYGTPFGSLISTQKYINSVKKYGFENASGAYFPDLVLNSTTGKICQALSLKNYSSSISSGGDEDLKSLSIAFNSLKNDYSKNLLVGSGTEESNLGNFILNKNIDTSSAFLSLSNEKNENTISKILFSSSFGSYNNEDVVKIMNNILYRMNSYKYGKKLSIYLQNNNINFNKSYFEKMFFTYKNFSYSENFSDGCFMNYIHDNSKKYTLLISLSVIGEVSYALIKKI